MPLSVCVWIADMRAQMYVMGVFHNTPMSCVIRILSTGTSAASAVVEFQKIRGESTSFRTMFHQVTAELDVL